jgi:hypothetical protein
MKIEKIDYAKKLMKFDKFVEATKVLENIIRESDDKLLLRNAIELLLIEIEFKQAKINNDKVLNLINNFRNNGGEEEKIKIFEKIFKDKLIQKKETILEFSNRFKELYYFFDNKFLTNNLDENLDENNFEIIDCNLAEKIAHDQDIEGPYESWKDLRAGVTKQVYSLIYKEKIKMDLFEKEIDRLNVGLEKKIENKNQIFYYFLDDMEADIHLILMAYYVEFSNKFIDLLLNAYKCNYLPCGWKGEYPQGKLCVTNGMQKFDET